MARPRSIQIDYARLADLRRQGYGKRRIAKLLGCSESTAGRALRGERPEGPTDRGPRHAEHTSAGSGRPGSEPRSTTGVRNTKRPLPDRRRRDDAPAPHAPVADWAHTLVLDQLSSRRRELPEVEFDETVARWAARLRRTSSSAHFMVLAELSLELSTSQRQRSRWLDDARRDLGRRWDHEIEFLQQLRESLRYSRSYDADLDARSQRLRLEELLPRRLAQLRTGSNCFEVVDTLVEDGLRRHRVTLKRLASEQAAEERRKGEAGAP